MDVNFLPVGDMFLKGISKMSGKARNARWHPSTSSSTGGFSTSQATGVWVEILEKEELFGVFFLKIADGSIQIIPSAGVKLRPWCLVPRTIVFRRGTAGKSLFLRHSWCFQNT